MDNSKQNIAMGRVDTEIFTYTSVNNYTCFAEVLNCVNNYILENKISRENILEYRSENPYNPETNEFTFTVTISWWKNYFMTGEINESIQL